MDRSKEHAKIGGEEIYDFWNKKKKLNLNINSKNEWKFKNWK